MGEKNQLQISTPEPVFKIIRWKIPVVDSKDSFNGYSAIFMKKRPTSADFSKRVKRFVEIVTTEQNRWGRPYSFAHVSVQKIREMNTKGVDSQKVSVSAPKPNCFYEYGKKELTHWVNSFPHFFVWIQAQENWIQTAKTLCAQAYLLCRWLQLAQLAKGKKSRP